MAKPMLSFVIPCYRSAHTIGAVVRELTDTVAVHGAAYDYEIILVNDGSPDDTAAVIRGLCRENPAILFVDLSRNFGQHSALMAGFHRVRGDIVICLDDDGQTPACECFKLIEKVEAGYDLVFAEYPKRRQSWLRNLGSRFNTACNHFFYNQPKDLTANSYYACRRFVVDTALQYPNPFPYVTGLLFQSVSRYCNVPVTHRARMEGQSGYNLKKLLALWLNGVTAFSIKPLRLASYVGWVTAFAGFVFAVVTMIRKLLNPAMPAGWASIISIILILGGVMILLMGIIGEYLGRIYLSINHYPQFVVRSVTRGEQTTGCMDKGESEASAHANDARGLGA